MPAPAGAGPGISGPVGTIQGPNTGSGGDAAGTSAMSWWPLLALAVAGAALAMGRLAVARVEPWLKRYSQPALVTSPSEGTPPEVRIKTQRDPSPKAELTEAQLRTVLDVVSQRMLVDIKEVLRRLGDESLKTAVLRAIEANRNVKAHPGPQTIYLQWRIA